MTKGVKCIKLLSQALYHHLFSPDEFVCLEALTHRTRTTRSHANLITFSNRRNFASEWNPNKPHLIIVGW